ncbi:hypothetical protein IJT10_03105 [bacterium]|nr:hypothetical protein [bacterium]
MNPLNVGMLASFCSEVLGLQKKVLKKTNSAGETDATDSVGDVYLPSEAAQAEQVEGNVNDLSTPQGRFLNSVAQALSSLDINSPNFMEESTSILVDSALKEAFGQSIESNPGYPQMQDKIMRTIFGDERYREILEDFLQTWVDIEENRQVAECDSEPDFEE